MSLLNDAAVSARSGLSGARVLLGAAILSLALAGIADELDRRLLALAAGLTFLLLLGILRLAAALDRWRRRRQERHVLALVGQDATPCFTTDTLGTIRFRNTAAEMRFRGDGATTLLAALDGQFASPGAVLYRLQRRAETGAAGREDVVTRRGHTRLSVHRIGEDCFLWRLEEFVDRNQPGRGADTLSLPMLVANRQGVVLFANEALRRLAGSRPKRLDRLFTEDGFRPGEEVTVSTAQGPVRALLAEVTGAGERREIYLLPVPDRDDSAVAMPDFDDLPVALMKIAPEGRVLTANRAARDMCGLASDASPFLHEIYEGLGRPVSDWLAEVGQGRPPASAEVLKRRGEGNESFHQVALRRVVEAGRPYVVAVLTDATAVKSLEAQVTQSQKMQAIGQLAGGIAHDFNNLLTAISGHCDLLLLRHEARDPDYEDLVQIHQNANRAAGLVAQLLSYSRKQTLKPERIDLPDELSDLAHLLNRLVGERITLRLDHDPAIRPIRVDRRHFEQVMMNLVVNARDAMPEGGTIRIATEALRLNDPLARDGAVVPAGDWSVIRVTDSGTGMSPEVMARIFEPFFTTKRAGEGTGLGLSTVYGIVKQSGGYIFAQSAPGQDTTFSLYFPVREGEDEARPTPSPAEPRRATAGPGEGVVLLVEDEAPVRAFASRALRMRGYTVIEAENAEEALQRLEDPSLEVDVFVTDVVMPGMDGPSWVRQALEGRPHVRVVFVSGYAEDCLSEDQARIPNSVFLPKPFSLSDLAATVQGQLH